MYLKARIAANMLREAAYELDLLDDNCPVDITFDFFTMRTFDLGRKAVDIRGKALKENDKLIIS